MGPVLAIRKKIEDTKSSERKKAISYCVRHLVKVTASNPLSTITISTGTGGQDNAWYGAYQSDGSVFNKNFPCHAYVKNIAGPLVFYNRYGRRPDMSKDAQKAYFDWVTSDNGPWKTFKGRNISHVPKSWHKSPLEFMFEYGWVWSNLDDHPVNLQHSFLVGARMVSEWPRLIELWYEWCQKVPKVNPGLVFTFLNLFTNLFDHKTGKISEWWQINRSNKYDWPVDTCTANEAYTKNFCTGTVVGGLLQPFSKTSQYTPVNTLWGPHSLSTYSETAYPSVLYARYSPKFGFNDKEGRNYWVERGLGFGSFKSVSHWVVREIDIIQILELEQKRLLG